MWWRVALADWRVALPKTFAALGDCEKEVDRSELAIGLQNGIKAGKAEHDKLYAYLDEPLGVIFFLFCRGRSGAFLRLTLAAFVRIGMLHLEDITGVLEPNDDDLLDPLCTKLVDNEFARAVWAYLAPLAARRRVARRLVHRALQQHGD